jgi:hypothetical protein
MGNDAASIEEAERIVRRRKAVVVYNAIVERENAKHGAFYSRYLYPNERGFFTVTDAELGVDLKPVHHNAEGTVRSQLTPELINDLFC